MYGRMIAASLQRLGLGADTRHIEAWMRLECGTLDGLSRASLTPKCVWPRTWPRITRPAVKIWRGRMDCEIDKEK